MNKLIVLFLGFVLTGTLYAAESDSAASQIQANLIMIEPPPPSGLNVDRMMSDDGIGIKLKVSSKDANKSRISWSLALSNEPPLKVISDSYYFLPARSLYQQQTFDGTSGRHYIDLILTGQRPGTLFNNRMAASFNIRQNQLQIKMRLEFRDNGEISVLTHPEPDSPVVSSCYLATETISGMQIIQLYLLPYKETYALWKTYFEGQYIVPPLAESTAVGEDIPDGLTAHQDRDVTPLALFTEFSTIGEAAAMETPMFDYVSSPIGF